MKYILLALFLFVSVVGAAQTGDNAGGSFTSGMPVSQPAYNLQQYLRKNVHYPKSARRDKVEGRVVVQFVVNADGSISDCKVIQTLREDCDAEALRVIKNMPPWKNRTVKTQYTQPLTFSLPK